MEQRLVCDTVRDLLPMYIEHMTSGASNESIEEHMGNCAECRAVLEQMKQPISVETAPEVKDFKKFLNKSKWNLFYWIMGVAAIIAIVTCFIVNLATERKLSWFYIVSVSLITAYLPAYVFIVSSKRKFVKALAVLSICVVALVGTVQMVLHYLMNIGEIWFWEIGLPVMALWLAIVWIGVASNVLFHANAVIALAIITFLAALGNILTDFIVGNYQEIDDLYIRYTFEGLGDIIIAAILLIIGCIIQIRKNRKTEG